jgi:hypothetical protein
MTIRDMDRASSRGLTAAFTKDSGLTESKKVKAYIPAATELNAKASGSLVSE